MQKISNRGVVLATALLTAALLAWDVSGLDMALAHISGGSAGFPLQENWFLNQVLHDGAKRAAWVLVLGLCLAAWWPPAWLKQLDFNRRLQLAFTPLLAVFVVSLLKSFSTTSCPWALADFGGVAHYSSHWAQLWQPDGGSGRCFPAGMRHRALHLSVVTSHGGRPRRPSPGVGWPLPCWQALCWAPRSKFAAPTL